MNSNIRTSWGSVKDFVGLPLGYCGDNPNLLPLVNEGCRLLWNAIDSIHHTALYRFRVGDSCCGARFITWPYEIETIESMRVCNGLVPVKNTYYEFIHNGLGNIQYQGDWVNYGVGYGNGRFRMLGDREEVPTYEDIRGTAKKLKAVNSLPADDGTQVLLLGYDDNNQWIRTLQSGIYKDGELLTLNASSPPTSTNYFSSIKGVQFSVTPRNGAIYLIEVNTIDSSERTISEYQYNEQNPVYRRSILSGTQFSKCISVDALVRLRFVDVIYDTDYLQIGNLGAIKTILLALQKRENGDLQNFQLYKQAALDILDDELRSYQGVSPKKNISFQRRELWGIGNNVR